jgi:hypothetical protein
VQIDCQHTQTLQKIVTGCTGLINVSLAVAMLLMLSSVIMSHFMRKYKYHYPQQNFHLVQNAYEQSKQLYNQNKSSWYGSLQRILQNSSTIKDKFTKFSM